MGGEPGVHVLRGAVQVGAGVAELARRAEERGQVVFNPGGRRLQLSLRRDHRMVRALRSALEERGLLLEGGRALRSPVLLHSLAGCRRQQWHTDWDPEQVAAARVKPMGVLLALTPGARFATPSRTYDLDVGDVVCFDGDVVHAGAEYPTTSNTRLHAYLDVPDAPRRRNSTWLWTGEETTGEDGGEGGEEGKRKE